MATGRKATNQPSTPESGPQRTLSGPLWLRFVSGPDVETWVQVILDATLITEVRTGAMTALGARHLARPDAKVLGHAGARGTARLTRTRPGRENADERILFWHRGLSILGIAVGRLVLERAEQAGLGMMARFR